MVVDDLRRLPTSPLILAEGSPLSPGVVSSGIADRSRAVWLIPTKEFQRAQLAERATASGAAWLYLLLAEAIEREARAHAVEIVAVDGSRRVEETAAEIECACSSASAATRPAWRP